MLDELAEIPIAIDYTIGGERVEEFPDDVEDLARVTPVYEVLQGWATSTSATTSFEKLPERARAYVARLEKLLGVPIVITSTGPRREETIFRSVAPLSKWLPGLFAAA